MCAFASTSGTSKETTFHRYETSQAAEVSRSTWFAAIHVKRAENIAQKNLRPPTLFLCSSSCSRVSGEINFLSFLALHSGINYYLLRHSSNSWWAKRGIAAFNPWCKNMFSVCNIFFLRTVKLCFAKWEFLFLNFWFFVF